MFATSVLFKWSKGFVVAKNVFVNAPLGEETYVMQPECVLEAGKENRFFLLRKGIIWIAASIFRVASPSAQFSQ